MFVAVFGKPTTSLSEFVARINRFYIWSFSLSLSLSLSLSALTENEPSTSLAERPLEGLKLCLQKNHENQVVYLCITCLPAIVLCHTS